MSETADDNTASDGSAIPITASPDNIAFNASSIGAETDSDFLTWDRARQSEYLQYLDNEWLRNRHKAELDFAVKKRLAQLLRLERELTTESLNDKIAPIKSILPAAARHVETARYHQYKGSGRVMMWCFIGLVLISLGAPAAWSAWIGARHGPAFLAFSVAEALVAYIALILTQPIVDKFIGSSSRKYSVSSQTTAYLAVALSSVCVVAFIFVSLFKRHHYPGAILEFAGGVGLVIVLVVLSFWGFVKLIYHMLWRRYRIHAKPSEVLLVDLVDLATSALPGLEEYYLDNLSRKGFNQRRRLADQPPFIYQLEAAAKRAERLFTGNIPRGHSDLRPWALDRAQRVAAVIRAHKRALLESSDVGDSSMSSSLFNGAAYLAQGNWDAFLVVQPEPTVRSFLRRFGGRIVLATLLAIGALAIPWLFPSLVPSTAATEFRATLLVTAAFSLVRPDLDKAREAFISFRQ